MTDNNTGSRFGLASAIARARRFAQGRAKAKRHTLDLEVGPMWVPSVAGTIVRLSDDPQGGYETRKAAVAAAKRYKSLSQDALERLRAPVSTPELEPVATQTSRIPAAADQPLPDDDVYGAPTVPMLPGRAPLPHDPAVVRTEGFSERAGFYDGYSVCEVAEVRDGRITAVKRGGQTLRLVGSPIQRVWFGPVEIAGSPGPAIDQQNRHEQPFDTTLHAAWRRLSAQEVPA